MPELPEAETIAADLRRHIVGRTVKRVLVKHADVLAPDLTPAQLSQTLRGRALEQVGRRGKNVKFDFAGGIVMLVNLGMTGRLVVASSPRAHEMRHVAVRFELDKDALLFDDVRRFGRIDVYDAESWTARD